MQDWIINFSTHHTYLIYAFIIITAGIEGPILSIIFGILIKLGYFSVLPVYLALMVGDLLGDTFWYWIGHQFGYDFVRKYGKYFSIDIDSIDRVKKIFHKYKISILTVSKLTTGFGFAIVTLFTAGLVKIPFRLYILLNVIGQFVWTGLLLFLGYYFSHLYLTFDHVLARMGIIAGFIIIVVAFVGFGKYMKKRLTE